MGGDEWHNEGMNNINRVRNHLVEAVKREMEKLDPEKLIKLYADRWTEGDIEELWLRVEDNDGSLPAHVLASLNRIGLP